MSQPRFDISNPPYMQRGMGANDAFLCGYRHGFEALNTPGICCLEEGTIERFCWLAGYRLGEKDSGQPPYPWDERTTYDTMQGIASWQEAMKG